MNKEKKRIIKFIRGYPLGEEFVFNEGWWEVGYKALDTVAYALEREDRDNAIKKKLGKNNNSL